MSLKIKQNFSVIALAISILTFSCQNQMESKVNSKTAFGGLTDIKDPDSKNNDKVPLVSVEQMQEVEKTSVEAENAMKEAETLLKEITDKSGDINIDFFSAKPTTQGFPSIAAPLKKVFDKILVSVDKLRSKIGTMRQKVIDSKLKLDPTNPAHIVLIGQLDQVLAKMVGLEDKFDLLLETLGRRLDSLVIKLDALKFKLATSPIGFVTIILIEQVKDAIVDFRNKLTAG